MSEGDGVALKYCKDCKWCAGRQKRWGGVDYKYAHCVNEAVNLDNDYFLVAATPTEGLHCTTARSHGPCGKEAKLWEAK